MVQKQGLLKEIEGRSGSFALIFLLLFGLTFGFLTLVGATPDDSGATGTDMVEGTNTPTTTVQVLPQNTTGAGVTESQSQTVQSNSRVSGELPIRITIKKIGLDVTVANPSSTDVDVLDQYLLKGAVRYPTSGQLGVNGTVLLFGHSSYLPIVHNKAYKSFDGIQDLKTGDSISVYAKGVEYQFSVTGVRVADANNDTISLPQDAQYLTLVTCDSFASKSNRYVVTADFTGAYLIQ